MNLFQLILKQMRQRSLSTLLTCLSVILGMALATSIFIVGREGRSVFAQTDYGYDMIVGPKASPLQLVLNTVYHLDASHGNIPYALYEDLGSQHKDSAQHPGQPNAFRGLVRWAVPYAVGDSYRGRRIVATTPQLFGVAPDGKPLPTDQIPQYRGGKHFTFAAGHPFAPNQFEAVIGSEVAKATGLKVGDTFHATHGFPTRYDIPDVHAETWTVVGILNETHTANDKVLFIPLPTFYAISEHESGLRRIASVRNAKPSTSRVQTGSSAGAQAAIASTGGYVKNPDGTIVPRLPQSAWEVSAVLVKSASPATALQLQFLLRNLPDAVAVSPAQVMEQFFSTFLAGTLEILVVISTLVTVVAGVSILVSIYNSVAARNREIAILRALGATRRRILTAVCLEAGLIGLLGGIIGLIAGHFLAAAGSVYLQRIMGTGIAWWRFGTLELLYLAAVVILCLLAGLAPALKAYRTPVAENLS